MAFPLLLSPTNIGARKVRNRVVITAHGASEAFRSPASTPDTYIEYLRRRAASAGLIITQPVFFTPGVEHPQWLLDRHAKLVETLHAEDAVVLLQLAHLGVYGRSDVDVHRPPLWGFSRAQSAAGDADHEMTDAEVELMVDAFRQAAKLAAQAGFDGVEVHGGHGYLIQQSLTPSWNSRTDRWGEDRTLFARRVIQAARDEVGPNGIVGYRTTVNALRDPEDGGIGFTDGVALLKRILGTGQVDLLNTTIGHGGPSYARAIPNYRYDEAPNIPALARFRAAADVRIPVIGVGKISSPAAAEQVLESGACDLVAMTRAHIADPNIVLKVRAGAGDRIRPCVGANVCANRKIAGFPEISCFHNPEVLREKELTIAPATVSRRVLVVGAGPAGLKAAEVATKRGHDVTIIDAGSQPGGRLRHAAATAASTLVASVEYLVAELAALGVAVKHGRVDESWLRDLRPDEVILASGAVPDLSSAFPDAAQAGVVDTAEALDKDLGQRVIVYDTVGANEGALVAEALAARGHNVIFVTPHEMAMPQGGELHRVELPEMLYRKVDRVIVRGMIGGVEDGVAVVATPEGDLIDEIEFNTLVAATPLAPDLRLVPALDKLGLAYQVVGDALAPRFGMQAFKTGYEAGLAI